MERQLSSHDSFIEEDITKVDILIKTGRGLCQRDYFGRTPLHAAIAFKSSETIKLFQEVLETLISSNKDKNNLKAIFKEIFEKYDHEGDTVLHKAVKLNYLEFVKVALKFCKFIKLNVVDYEKLGNGDSILHLAVRENLLEMTEIIIEEVPKLLDVENYGGTLPQDIPNISPKLKNLLETYNK